MAVLVFAEHADGHFKKPAFEALTYGHDLAKAKGLALHAVVVGDVSADELGKLAQYGASATHHIQHEKLSKFVEAAYASAVAEAAKAAGAQYVVLPQTYNGRAIAPRIAVKTGLALLSGVSTLPEGANNAVKRVVYSNKAIQTQGTKTAGAVITVKGNAYGVAQNAVSGSVSNLAYTPADKDFACVPVSVIKNSDKVSLTEADVVVSAGRGLKGPENWGMIDELADLLGAATACSKPVADVHWRPHHEHVGQTGIQVSPNVYIAVGISGAIQHLAGVSSSKTIIVVNKDGDAPFFKAADFGVIGDAFEVIPNLIKAVKAHKGA